MAQQLLLSGNAHVFLTVGVASAVGGFEWKVAHNLMSIFVNLRVLRAAQNVIGPNIIVILGHEVLFKPIIIRQSPHKGQ